MLTASRRLQLSYATARAGTMSGWFSGIGRALGFGSKPAASGQETAVEAPACYPDDVPFEDGPCSGCADPCSGHKQIPDYLKIDTESPLLGSMKPYRRHVLFQTPGQHWNNWSPKLDEGEGTLGSELSAAAKAAGGQLGYRIIVTAIDNHPSSEGGALPCPWLKEGEALVLPDLVALGPLTADNAKAAMEEFLARGKVVEGVSARELGPWQPADANASPASSAAGPLTACVLVCAHKLRDKRCGVAGPMIMEELATACAQKGLQDKVSVVGCSHVGGHKFAGNLIVYSPQGGHWYGRVKPCHAPAIVDTHILQGKVLKELWRGRMEP